MRFLNLPRLIEIMEINGVKVRAHWSVLLISGVILLGAIAEPSFAFAVLGSYYGVILLHEIGHMIAAQQKGCRVFSIELYPIWGITRFSEPYSRFDHGLIAWGGVAAQAIVAVPMVAFIKTIGFTRFQPLNAILAIFGFFNLAIAAFNLLPVPPLDGAVAWGLLPALLRRPAARPAKREDAWRSWR